MVTVASRVPVVAGVKVALILQVLFGDREEGQLLVWAKSPLLVPATWIDLIAKLMLPIFWSITVCGALLMPTVWFPKFKLVGESETTAPWTTWYNTGEVLEAKLNPRCKSP